MNGTTKSACASALATAIAFALGGCGGGGGGGDDSSSRLRLGLDLKIVSSRPDMVSGGNALVRVDTPTGAVERLIEVKANGRDVTSAFQRDPAGGGLLGVVSGLRDGDNTIDVSYEGVGGKSITVRNYPINGPIISGPHEQPFVCRTSAFVPFPNTPALGSPLDQNCSVATRVQYVYRTTANAFAVLPSPDARPDNLAFLTIGGKNVPYIVRLETGTINRAIYQTAILHDPRTDPAPSPVSPPAGWSKKLIYPLGGGCQGGWYQQGLSIVDPVNHSYLSRGFGVASATLNTFGNNCNDLLSSETILMVKERFIESYGVPVFTIGTGSSGGAYQSNQTADNYPGTFDGIVTTNSFPDVTTGMVGLADARLLDIYFNTTRPSQYTADQQKAISGFSQVNEITFLSDRTGTSTTSARRMDPSAVFAADTVTPGVGTQFRYHPVDNPLGARATVYDHTVNVYGRIPNTPSAGQARFSKRPLDNVGVQYGLKALNDRVISVDQFIDLNRSIGGVDIDFKHIPERTTAYLDATRRAYQSGRILYGGNGLAEIPIITRTGYGDAVVNGDIHLKYWAYSIRERLVRVNGNHDNQVIVSHTAPTDLLIDQMDRWLTAIAADGSDRSKRQKAVANKPADVVDACWAPDGTKIVEPQTAFGSSRCNTLFPTSSAPNLVAGAPLASDVIKCQLKPVDASDYRVTVTPDQLNQIRAVFPNGVCDWSKPGVEQVKAEPWLSFGPSPTNLLFDVTRQ